jgi:hypothetical protein
MYPNGEHSLLSKRGSRIFVPVVEQQLSLFSPNIAASSAAGSEPPRFPATFPDTGIGGRSGYAEESGDIKSQGRAPIVFPLIFLLSKL